MNHGNVAAGIGSKRLDCHPLLLLLPLLRCPVRACALPATTLLECLLQLATLIGGERRRRVCVAAAAGANIAVLVLLGVAATMGSDGGLRR